MSIKSHSYKDFLDDNEHRHVLGISGGKDSAALAIYIKDRHPEIHEKMEYFFTDTGAELDEVYSFLEKLETYLGKKINMLSNDRKFDHWLTIHNNLLPSPKARWCTQMMKIKPFEAFVKDDPVISYVGIRADENREGYVSKKDSIKAVFPFVEDGLVRDDIFQLLEDSVGIPEYYKWRSRSGCYFCFFQRQEEWLGLKRRHPDLFEKAKKLEEIAFGGFDWVNGERKPKKYGYTWSAIGPLDEVIKKAEKNEEEGKLFKKKENVRWQDTLRQDDDDDDPEDQACIICSL